MKKKLRYGIIGLNGICGKHLDGYGAMPDDVEIVACCDIVEERLQKVADKYNIPRRYTDYHELLAQPDIDFVSICLPNNLHASATIEALRAGKHVHCEKPMAMNDEECAEMIAARNETGLQLMIGLNNRFTPQAQFIKRLVEQGYFGDIYFAKCGWLRRNGLAHAGWFLDKEFSGGGPLIDLGVHMIDLTMYLMGFPELDTVLAKCYTKFGDNEKRMAYTQPRVKADMNWKCNVEDLATGFLTLKNDASLQFEISWASNIEKEKIYYDLYGTEAGVHVEICDGVTDMKLFSTLDQQMVTSTVEINSQLVGENEFAHFLRSMRENTPPTISVVEQAAETIRIIRGIYKSAETGKPVVF